jgi:serine/threonine-protein kinase HipA
VRWGEVFFDGHPAGVIKETDEGYEFSYYEEWLATDDARPVSLTLPLQSEAYRSTTMFPFFDGLIPEGWLLSVAQRTWKVDPRDRMGLLLSVCEDPIGAVHVERRKSPRHVS